jgi:glycosyltransferase involved in cell wall biosynthesis
MTASIGHTAQMLALISIAVPIYNTARFLPAALDSVLAQDHADWEGLLWDDGSTDGSGDIAASYAEHDARFRVMGNGRQNGNPHALANALAPAMGDFIGVLDSDDVLEPNALSAMLQFMQANRGVGMAYSQHIEIDEAGGYLRNGTCFLTPYSPQRLLVDFMTYQFRLIHAGAYRAVGGYDPGVDESADYDLCLRLSEQYAIGYFPQSLYRYRIRHDSISRGSRLRQVRTTFEAAKRALQRRGLTGQFGLSLGVRARHSLNPKQQDLDA